jgi:hypothetical protein
MKRFDGDQLRAPHFLESDEHCQVEAYKGKYVSKSILINLGNAAVCIIEFG